MGIETTGDNGAKGFLSSWYFGDSSNNYSQVAQGVKRLPAKQAVLGWSPDRAEFFPNIDEGYFAHNLSL